MLFQNFSDVEMFFGKIVSGIKKVGGFIFKGIKGLLHRRKTTALLNAARAFKGKAKMIVGNLYKLRRFHGLHLSKSSLTSTLRRTWDKTKFWFTSCLCNSMNETILAYHLDPQKVYASLNYTNKLMSFLNYRHESLFYLEKTVVNLHHFLYGLERLASGKLSNALIPARRLHRFLHKIYRAVAIQHPQFVPLYTELYHYYESAMTTYSNLKDHIFIQIPIFFVNKNQQPLQLFRIHHVPVPLDIDTYQSKESKYTTLQLSNDYIAANSLEFMELTSLTLQTCHSYHMDYLCEMIHLTTDVLHPSCSMALLLDSLEGFSKSHNTTFIKQAIHARCNFTYHEVSHQQPQTLQTQDEILIANFSRTQWQLICDEITDKPTQIQGALYTVINLFDLCTCGILANGRFLYESMRTCPNPDTKVSLYYTYNRALTNYDSSINHTASKAYAKQPYPFQAPDLNYIEQQPYFTANGTHHIREKRHSPDAPGYRQAVQ